MPRRPSYRPNFGTADSSSIERVIEQPSEYPGHIRGRDLLLGILLHGMMDDRRPMAGKNRCRVRHVWQQLRTHAWHEVQLLAKRYRKAQLTGQVDSPFVFPSRLFRSWTMSAIPHNLIDQYTASSRPSGQGFSAGLTSIFSVEVSVIVLSMGVKMVLASISCSGGASGSSQRTT